jgi:hypothetical protein
MRSSNKPLPVLSQITLASLSTGFFVWLAFLMVATNLTAATYLTAATFPGNADLTVSDPTGALSWNSTNDALSVQCSYPPARSV